MIKHSKVKSIFILTLTSKIIILGSLLSYENTAPTESVENKSVNEQVCIQQETSKIENEDLPIMGTVSIKSDNYFSPVIEIEDIIQEDATIVEEEMEDTKTTTETIAPSVEVKEKKYIQGWVSADINVRQQPSTNSKVLEVYPYNTKIEYTNYNNKWVEIKYKNNTVAYLFKSFISKEKNPDIIIEEEKEEKQEQKRETKVENSYSGSKLTKSKGINQGPSGGESYYNLPMSGVIELMESLGYNEEYWVRDDGCKMYGDYIMVAADTSRLPKGTILETSLGTAMVCDYCGYAARYDGVWLDIAVDWQ